MLPGLWAQKKLSYPEAEKRSYELFREKKWAELIDFGELARSRGIDFFYLQARTGIAFYNLEKYRKAAKWFYKAWENDQSFEWLQEYLYYSLLFGGRQTEASKIAENFTVPLKEKINFQSMKPLRAAVETGYSFNPGFSELSNTAFDQQLNVGENYGEAFFLKNYHFESLDFSHQLGPGIHLSHNFTHMGINREEQVFWGSRETFPVKINQNQYFISPLFVLGKKWYISPALSVIWGNSDLWLGNYAPGDFYRSTLKWSDRIFTTSTWTHIGNFSPGAEINFANISDNSITQASAWITFYPLSNTRLYMTPRIYLKKDAEGGFAYNTFGLSGGVQMGPVHFYGQYLRGDMENFIESAGYVIANFPGTSRQKFTGSLYFPTGKRYQFVLRYINQQHTEKYRVYTNQTESSSTNYHYTKHTITAGVSWSF